MKLRFQHNFEHGRIASKRSVSVKRVNSIRLVSWREYVNTYLPILPSSLYNCHAYHTLVVLSHPSHITQNTYSIRHLLDIV